jgi:hypothetical protein
MFWLLAAAPRPLLLLTLALSVYLTVIELREFRPPWRWWAWWISFVVLTHFIGYLILRGYRAYRRLRHSRA